MIERKGSLVSWKKSAFAALPLLRIMHGAGEQGELMADIFNREKETMRMLFEMDKKDYNIAGNVCRRPSVRAIILKDGKAAMVYSRKYDYYKFPGGGMEAGESREDALIREVLEETGLLVIRASIREYGQVCRIQKGTREEVFIQDNYYFLCSVQEEVKQQRLDAYEAEEGFTLVYVKPQYAIAVNTKNAADNFRGTILERDARVLEILMQEGYFAGEEM